MGRRIQARAGRQRRQTIPRQRVPRALRHLRRWGNPRPSRRDCRRAMGNKNKKPDRKNFRSTRFHPLPKIAFLTPLQMQGKESHFFPCGKGIFDSTLLIETKLALCYRSVSLHERIRKP